MTSTASSSPTASSGADAAVAERPPRRGPAAPPSAAAPGRTAAGVRLDVFAKMAEASHEQVVFCRDPASGLHAIIAIHNTTLGPALGGTRMWPYASEEEALIDVLRLSEGMTYKAAVTGLNLGGGKAVIIGDSRHDKTEALLRAHGVSHPGQGSRAWAVGLH